MASGVVKLGLVLIVAACNVLEPPGAVDETGRELLEQSYQPPYPVDLPAGRLVRIDDASLDVDHVILTVRFVGSKGFLASDPCSENYVPWVGGRAEQLEVAIVEIATPRPPMPPNFGCTSEGYGHTYHLALPAPFDGVEILDRSGARLLVGEPDLAAALTEVPDGWVAVHADQQCCGEPATWVTVYAKEPVEAPPFEGPGRLVLYEAFGITGEWSDLREMKSEQRGGHPEAGTMEGRPVEVWVDAESGELLLSWDTPDRSYGLIGNSADMTVDELIAYAESLAINQP